MLLPLLLIACKSAAPTGPAIVPYKGKGPRPNLVMVTLDTTRADRLGAYGYDKAQTETIDTFAKNGIRFEQAFSPLPLTIPAHSTLFTGLMPYHHHIRSNGDNVLAPEFTTLAEILQKNGYATGASVAAFVTNRQWGFAQGFNAYFDALPEDQERNFWHTERRGDMVVDDALNWLKTQKDGPVFLWVHLYDAHFPYAAPADYVSRNPDRPYDAELAYVDDQIQRLVDAFKDRKTLWCLVGDHGESLGEHNELTHGNQVYNATQHVPWILSGSGILPGVISDPVSTADVTPTLLRLLGLDIPADLDGKPQPGSPVVPYSESYQFTERFHLAPQRAVVEANLKLIANPQPELYDLKADPNEKNNLAGLRPEDVKRMLQLLQDKAAEPPGKASQSMDPDTLARLASLGYVAEGGIGTEDPFSLPDPKDYQDVFASLFKLESGATKAEDQINLLQQFQTRLPQSFELRNRLFMLLSKTNRPEEARGVLDAMAATFPDNPRVWLTMSQTVQKDGDTAAALALAEKALALDPSGTSAQEVVISLLLSLKRDEEATTRGAAFMEANHSNYGVAAQLGAYYLRKNQLPEAERHLRVAVSAPNPARGARVQLALLALAANVRADAYTLLNEEIKEYPGNIMAHRILANMLGSDKRYLEQVPHLEIVAAAFPDDTILVLSWAQAMFNAQDYRGARRVVDGLLAQAPDAPDVLLLHANLLAKEGHMEEGRAVFMRADAMNSARIKAAEADAAAQKKGGKK